MWKATGINRMPVERGKDNNQEALYMLSIAVGLTLLPNELRWWSRTLNERITAIRNFRTLFM